ncbi:unnamed protein product [Rotaria sordida]|uniref:P-type phospholipid transporter n=1 Tax=Rotaria sordida TaxID=392033 RepID=A0A813R557_9BILA|nr:unnamed protein product [Rotaria sordida]CAF0776773.1 unnamed protein product [Rotaria sordida]CAF0779148.1 unnamed protein product [Rotaria sordida]
MNKIPFLKKKEVEEENRTIRANDPEANTAKEFAGNQISTSKYNLITFLPKNLFEQFRRLANAYFLFLLCLQLIPQISSLAPVTTILPLVFVLSLTAIKDASDDIARHRSDSQVNNCETKTVVGNELVTRKWKDIKVDDMIRLENNEFVTTDIVLISTSEPNSLCYIETAELDGETNLKARQVLEETCALEDHIDQLSNFHGKTLPLKNDNVLLHGTRLRNTQWDFGIVCYAGPDTKLMKNNGKAKFKRTKIDYLLNRIILGIFLFLLIMCAIMTICSDFWELFVGYDFSIYLPWETYVSTNQQIDALEISLLVFLSYIIILNIVVSISLYVSVEFICLLQSKWIDWDIKIYYELNNVQAQACTTTLNEELGQIEYIFSDKTGTLIQNIMTFNKCSIREKLYDYVTDEAGNEIQDTEKLKPIEFEEKEKDDYFQWYNQILLDTIKNNDKDVNNFFALLSLCHTIMPEEKDGKIIYQAQSFDENVLVSASRTFDFVFLIIVKKDGKLVLYCKGADSKIKERLDSSEKDIMTETDEHLNKFATEDFRTLYLAYRELNESEYREWSEKMNQANTSMEKREEKVKDAYEQIENHLKLIGATAIEDKLQDGVPQCIERLACAGIKIWVLTGDKIGFGLLITGQALGYALENKLKMKFLELGTMCKAVVCCRVTLLQKAQVIELVMQNEKKTTLAIGDGANDVSMIQKAHIRVGISGQEGRQAVLASDYRFGQFRFLERLLLVHVRWSYLRISKFLRYFFYKNCAFTLCHFWFGFFSGFSAQTIYDPFFVAAYNVFFSSLSVLALGVFDQNMEVKKTAAQLLQEIAQKHTQEKIADQLKIASLEVENKLLREALFNNNQQSTSSFNNMVYGIVQYAPVLIGLLMVIHYWK